MFFFCLIGLGKTTIIILNKSDEKNVSLSYSRSLKHFQVPPFACALAVAYSCSALVILEYYICIEFVGNFYHKDKLYLVEFLFCTEIPFSLL